jgi:hypothetical protein
MAAFGVVGGQRDGGVECLDGLLRSLRSSEELTSGCMKEVIVVESFDELECSEPGLRTVGHRYRYRMVEPDDW